MIVGIKGAGASVCTRDRLTAAAKKNTGMTTTISTTDWAAFLQQLLFFSPSLLCCFDNPPLCPLAAD